MQASAQVLTHAIMENVCVLSASFLSKCRTSSISDNHDSCAASFGAKLSFLCQQLLRSVRLRPEKQLVRTHARLTRVDA